ncbi:2-aminobenzoate-CoA ligase [Nocardioides massiliensis]|uniref:2-aminobenzoate-CoA ligase n=1 Tax=Nocardioides massiliensis TaxID=1325935 RepID=A0ABT9NL43_9ACTN|nr:class I adenylate-forming enzyme family protein [Nocardioides massiliensis]MDP9821139.1 2-aminobenzoate-CoA ligase [Nocardioides massiliensis]
MKDTYPDSTIPAHCLVPPGEQPEYTHSDDPRVDDWSSTGWALSDAQVEAGHGDAVALVHAESGRSYSYREVADLSTRLAEGLVHRGVQTGDRIAFRGPNVPELIIGMLAAWKAGAVVVPTPVQSRPDELRFFVEDTGARLLVVVGGSEIIAGAAEAVAGTDVEEVLVFRETPVEDPSHRDLRSLRQEPDAEAVSLPRTPSDGVAVIWHTGGTTGQPKGCYHTHRRFLLGGYALAEVTGAGPGQRWAAAAPAGHALGFIYHTNFTLLHGATAVLIEEFRDPRRIVEAINDYEINVFTAITATWVRMADVLDERSMELPSLHRAYAMWQSASATDVRRRWLERGLELINNYGSTAFATWPLTPRHGEVFPPGSLGRALPGYEVRVVRQTEGRVEPIESGPGQMAVRGLTGLTYWNRPELQRRDVIDGWSLCDDLIEFDDTGNATYLGRTDYLISTAGYKVAPTEVELTLGDHPAVREVAVVGAPDPLRQEIVVAFVSVQDGATADDALASELQSFVRDRLSPYKYPRQIHFVPELPRDAVGKIRGKVLKTWASGAGDAAPMPTMEGPTSTPDHLEGTR